MSIEPVPPDPELSATESALADLRPARGGVDRDRVMFLAGAASARRAASPGPFWRAAAAVLAVVASGEGALLATRPGPTVIVRTIRVPTTDPPVVTQAPAPPPPVTAVLAYPPAFGQTDHARLVSQVVRYGLDGLPASSPTSADPSPIASRQQWLEELNRSLVPGDPS